MVRILILFCPLDPDFGLESGPHLLRASQQIAQKLNLTKNVYILLYAPRQHFFFNALIPTVTYWAE